MCVRDRERTDRQGREDECGSVCVRERERMRERGQADKAERMRVRVCVRERERENEREVIITRWRCFKSNGFRPGAKTHLLMGQTNQLGININHRDRKVGETKKRCFSFYFGSHLVGFCLKQLSDRERCVEGSSCNCSCNKFLTTIKRTDFCWSI